nr:hypothetical protein [Yersinia phage Rostov 43]
MQRSCGDKVVQHGVNVVLDALRFIVEVIRGQVEVRNAFQVFAVFREQVDRGFQYESARDFILFSERVVCIQHGSGRFSVAVDALQRLDSRVQLGDVFLVSAFRAVSGIPHFRQLVIRRSLAHLQYCAGVVRYVQLQAQFVHRLFIEQLPVGQFAVCTAHQRVKPVIDQSADKVFGVRVTRFDDNLRPLPWDSDLSRQAFLTVVIRHCYIFNNANKTLRDLPYLRYDFPPVFTYCLGVNR